MSCMGEDLGESILLHMKVDEVYQKYGTQRGTRGAMIYVIIDPKVRFTTQVMA